MIYDHVTTTAEARQCIVSFYWELLRDHLETGDPLQTPDSYLADVLSAAPGEVDGFGHDIEHLIQKACRQPNTVKKLTKVYKLAQEDPKWFLELVT